MKIGVVGLGLIGGSIFKDLKKLGHDVLGISQSQCGENIYKSYDYLKTCDLVFVCSAMNKVQEVLDELEKYLNESTVVTDVCSLKGFVSEKSYKYKFVPSHPMAGTEKKGYENSIEGLFKGAKWVITPINGVNSEYLVGIIKELGASPIITTPEKHDVAVALISHIPMIISQAIFKNAQDNELAMEIASSGFRDMTRLSMSNPEMALDMVELNAENIQTGLLSFYESVGELLNESYYEQISEIRSKRQKMFQ